MIHDDLDSVKRDLERARATIAEREKEIKNLQSRISDPEPILEPWYPPPEHRLDDYKKLEKFLVEREDEIIDMAGWGVLMCVPRYSPSNKKFYLEIITTRGGYFGNETSIQEQIRGMVAEETGLDILVTFAYGEVSFL